MTRLRFPIAAKFAVILLVMVLSLGALAISGLEGLGALKSQNDRLYARHVVTIQLTSALAHDVSRASRFPLELSGAAPAARPVLEAVFGATRIPAVSADLVRLRAAHAGDSAPNRAQIERIAAEWARFLSLTNEASHRVSGVVPVKSNQARYREIGALFTTIEGQLAYQTEVEASKAAAGARQAQASYRSSRDQLILIGCLAMLIGIGIVGSLIRAVVPRIRRYSTFARQVVIGNGGSGLEVTGEDEISDLGIALNEMVARRAVERDTEDAQLEFAEVLQLTESETEAHQLLKRQIERSIAEAGVVMLNRNNSADRLQTTTPLQEGSPLALALQNAKPRSCLAVRFARTHSERPDRDPLVGCELCGGTGGFSTCEPLLVGGEVIGSVLASHPRAPTDADMQSIRRSVAQAAPVLANLRNLALAEGRAKTDALTGLPNNRNAKDTVKRMVAHASRTVSPLSALALDLDHFKDINDQYGHGAGDDVLAALGATLKGVCRESDFVGRVGGEEFLVLLPDTGPEAAQVVAESIRVAVAAMSLPSIGRAITISIGIAAVPDHAGDSTRLLRNADRALYAAKNNGRNRTEMFTQAMNRNQPGYQTDTEATSGGRTAPHGRSAKAKAAAGVPGRPGHRRSAGATSAP